MSQHSGSARSIPLRVALIGHPVAHSRSPQMQGAAFAAIGMSIRYELWDTCPGDLGACVARLREPDMLGANVTIPYKVEVAPLLDALAPEVRRAGGAVNTITRTEVEGGRVRLTGHNTDLRALIAVIEEHQRARAAQAGNWPDAGAPRVMLILGAGGAARAAVGAARTLCCSPVVAARNPKAGEAALLASLSADRGGAGASSLYGQVLDLADRQSLADLLPRVGVLAQTTSVGMEHPEQSVLPLDVLDRVRADTLVVDMVYALRETALVEAARRRGLRAVGGLDMLLFQGMAAFTLWTGKPAPQAEMRAALMPAQ